MQETSVLSLSREDALEEGHGNPLQHSCLENPMDRGAWRATVHGVARVRHDLATKLSLPTILVNFQEDCLRDQTLLALRLFLRRPNQILRKTSGDGDGRQPRVVQQRTERRFFFPHQ